mmetsp:Transcript_4499/g.13216  ORF Transcript_4499/g.13216 Transcript_4499/m.13216 type:complete len:240 (+) Transcript_4499:1558-2277(+)
MPPPGPSATSQRTPSQAPRTAVKRHSPRTRAIAAPHPSLTSGCSRTSLSRSSKLLTIAALTKVSLVQPEGRLARFSISFLWKFRAQYSAAAGPGSPAHDCPSNSAKSPIGARFWNMPVVGNSIFILSATLRRHLTMTCRERNLPLAPPWLTASTSTFGGTIGFLSLTYCKLSCSAASRASRDCCWIFHSGVPEYPSWPPTPWLTMWPAVKAPRAPRPRSPAAPRPGPPPGASPGRAAGG